jgi:hypothetical protein
MGTSQVTDFPIATTLEDADIFWATRGTGVSRDKTVSALLLQKYIGDVAVNITATGSIDLNNYFSNLVLLCDPSAGIALTISGALPEGKKLFIINLSGYLVNITIEALTIPFVENEWAEWISDGADMNKLWNIFQNFTKVKYLTSTDSPYTIGDGETYQKYIGDTTGGDIILNLPTLADNYEKEYKILLGKQNGSFVNKMIVQREGSDVISQDLLSIVWLAKVGDQLDLIGSSGTMQWEISNEKLSAQLILDTLFAYGTTDTMIPKFSNTIENFGNVFSHNHGSYGTAGLELTINKSGRYSSSVWGQSPGYIGFSINSAQKTTAINLITITNCRGYDFQASGAGTTAPSLYLKKGDIWRPHGDGTIPSGSRGGLIFTYLG